MSLNSSLLNPRFERKFVAAGYSVQDVLALVRRHPTGFREVFPLRLIHNVYLDTPSLTDYREHVSGSANRQKTRVRWYGPMNGEALKPVLERKLKRGLVSGKVTEPLKSICRAQAFSRTGLQAVLTESRLPEPMALSLRFLEPSLYNCYRRHYFASMNGHVRLTVDSGLNFAPPANPGSGAPETRECNCGPIIELKYAPQHAEDAADICNRLPFRLARCSKYVLGIERVALS